MARFIAVLVAVGLMSLSANGEPVMPTASEHLKDIATSAVKSAQKQFGALNIKDDEVGVSVIDMRDAEHLTIGSYRGDAPFYPASTVKLFYMVAAEQRLEEGKLTMSPELERALSDMIVTSNNAACQFILDAVTETTNGQELSPAEMEKWVYRRNWVNRYFAEKGYTHINTNQATYIDSLYGLVKIYNAGGANRNLLTTSAAARLMSEIVLHKIVTPARCDAMLKLLHRDPTTKPTNNPDDQNLSFTAKVLGEGDKLWCKAGWTQTNRHDVAYVETKDGLKLVITIFTANHGYQRQILPAIAKSVMDGVRAPTAAASAP